MKKATTVALWSYMLLTLLALAGLSLHLVHGPNGWAVAPKSHLTFQGTYVDGTAWSAADLARSEDLKRSLDAYGWTAKLWTNETKAETSRTATPPANTGRTETRTTETTKLPDAPRTTGTNTAGKVERPAAERPDNTSSGSGKFKSGIFEE